MGGTYPGTAGGVLIRTVAEESWFDPIPAIQERGRGERKRFWYRPAVEILC